MPTFSGRRLAGVLNNSGIFPGAGSLENPAAHYLNFFRRRAPCAAIPAAHRGSCAGPAEKSERAGPATRGSERFIPLRAWPGRTGRFSPPHAGECGGFRIYRRPAGDRNMARHEYRPSAQNPGLRADGTPRLRADFDAAFLAFFGPPGRLPPKRMPLASPTSIELKAALRYTGTRLRVVERAFRGAAAASPTIPEFIVNISKA